MTPGQAAGLYKRLSHPAPVRSLLKAKVDHQLGDRLRTLRDTAVIFAAPPLLLTRDAMDCLHCDAKQPPDTDAALLSGDVMGFALDWIRDHASARAIPCRDAANENARFIREVSLAEPIVYTKIVEWRESGVDFAMHDIHNWTDTSATSLFAAGHRLVLPVHIAEPEHWLIGVGDWSDTGMILTVVDSARDPERAKTVGDHVIAWLRAVYKQSGATGSKSWDVITAPSQQQDNTHNCGIFAIHNAFVAACEARPDYVNPEDACGKPLRPAIMRNWIRQCICVAGCANHTCSAPDVCRPFPFMYRERTY
jgi:hypothetical protein